MKQPWWKKWWVTLTGKTAAGTILAYAIIVYLPPLTGFAEVKIELWRGALLWLSVTGVFVSTIILLLDYIPELFQKFSPYALLLSMIASIVLIATLGEESIQWKLTAGMFGFASAILFFFPVRLPVEEEPQNSET